MRLAGAVTTRRTSPLGIRREEPAYGRLITAMFLVGVATFAQMYSTQPVLPEIAAEFGITASFAVLSVAATTLGVALGVLPWSYIADRLGTRRALIVALCAALLPGIAAPLMPTFELFVAMRFVEGLGLAGVPAIAVPFVLASVDARHGASAGAIYIAGTTAGGLSGRLLAAPVTEMIGWRPAVIVVMGLCAVATLGFILLLPDAARPAPVRVDIRAIPRLLADPRQVAIYAIAFVSMGGFVSLYNYLGFRLSERPYELPPTIIGFVFVAYLAGTWSSALSGRLVPRWGRRVVAGLGAVVMAAGVFAMFAAPLPVVIAGVAVATAGFFAIHAVASGWAPASASSGKNQAGALYNLAYYAGSSVLGWATGFAYGTWGWPGVGVAVLLLTAGVLLLLLALPQDRRARRTAAG